MLTQYDLHVEILAIEAILQQSISGLINSSLSINEVRQLIRSENKKSILGYVVGGCATQTKIQEVIAIEVEGVKMKFAKAYKNAGIDAYLLTLNMITRMNCTIFVPVNYRSGEISRQEFNVLNEISLDDAFSDFLWKWHLHEAFGCEVTLSRLTESFIPSFGSMIDLRGILPDADGLFVKVADPKNGR